MSFTDDWKDMYALQCMSALLDTMPTLSRRSDVSLPSCEIFLTTISNIRPTTRLLLPPSVLDHLTQVTTRLHPDMGLCVALDLEKALPPAPAFTLRCSMNTILDSCVVLRIVRW